MIDQAKYGTKVRQKNWTKNEYHIQDIKYVSCTTVKISCTKAQFPILSFIGPHRKPHGVRVLSKHCHLILYLKLVHDKCAIQWISCACVLCTNMLDKPWDPSGDHSQQPCYQPVVECTLWPVSGTFNNWNIIQFTNKTTSSEDIEKVHKFVLDGISENMASLV